MIYLLYSSLVFLLIAFYMRYLLKDFFGLLKKESSWSNTYIVA
jgi:hypothetical protein